MRISEKAKKTVSRKTFMAVVVSMMVCLLFVTPVFAASSFYSKTTTKLNAINGGKGWWSDLVDNNPPSGSIDGNYATSVTVHWVSGISYVNASCTTMTQMTLDYLVPFGIIVG